MTLPFRFAKGNFILVLESPELRIHHETLCYDILSKIDVIIFRVKKNIFHRNFSIESIIKQISLSDWEPLKNYKCTFLLPRT